MTQFPVAGGNVVITDDTVELDLSVFGAIQRLYRESKIISVIVVFCTMALIILAALGDRFSQFLILFAIVFALLLVVIGRFNQSFRPHISSDTKIPRDAIEAVAYEQGEGIRRPRFVIIYQKDGEQKVSTDVYLLPTWITGSARLEHALSKFEDSGIETKPTEVIKGLEIG